MWDLVEAIAEAVSTHVDNEPSLNRRLHFLTAVTFPGQQQNGN
jgi:hypothetical protein